MEWKKIRINIQNIETETEKAFLIRMPNKSEYKNFVFWISKKLVRKGSHTYEAVLSMTEDFTFEARRYGSKSNVLERKTLDFNDLKDSFSGND